MNTIRQLLNRGGYPLGCFLSEIAAPNLLRVMKAGGIDFVIIDCEHGPFDFSQVSAVAAVGNGIGLFVIVRIPGVSREHVQKYLDAGVDGLLLPMTNTPQQAAEFVQLAKYPPVGKRGISITRPHSNYVPGELNEYLTKANDRVMLLVQIETIQGVNNCSKIASVDGVDVVMVGPNDLAADYGYPGEFYRPEIQEALQTIAASAKNARKPSGSISSDLEFLKECKRLGMSVFSCDSEVGILHKGIKSIVNHFNS